MAIQTNFTEDESQKTAEELYYYSEELTGKIHGELIFLSVLNIFLSITAFLGNTLILVALHKETSLYPLSKLLYRNLAITDLCVGIIAEPLYAIYLISLIKQSWYICYYLDWAGFITGAILCSASLFTLTAISVDRLFALLLGLKYRQVSTLRKAYISVIVMWVLSVVIGAAIYVLDTLIVDWATLIIISLSVAISSLCYTKIFYALRKRSQIHVQDRAFQGQPSQATLLNISRYRKAVYNALWVQVTFVVCYLPFGIAAALTPVIDEMPFSVYLIALTLLLSNSSLNPSLYCWKIREVRQAVKDTIRQLFC